MYGKRLLASKKRTAENADNPRKTIEEHRFRDGRELLEPATPNSACIGLSWARAKTKRRAPSDTISSPPPITTNASRASTDLA